MAIGAALAPAAFKAKEMSTLKVKRTSKKGSATHPPTATMVNNAIKNLKERGGSSLQAIKKYISSTYKVDGEKVAPFIKKYLKSAVEHGSLIRTKGTGASGSFKLMTSETNNAKKVGVTKLMSGAAKASSKTKKSKTARKIKTKEAPATKKLNKPKPKKVPKKVLKKVRITAK